MNIRAVLPAIAALALAGQAMADTTISGTIQNKSGKPIAGARVIAWDSDPTSKDDRMGDARTDRNGRYTIRYKNDTWDGANKTLSLGNSWRPDIYITVDIRSRGQWERIGKSDILPDQPEDKRAKISLRLDHRNAFVRRSIHGTIRNRKGRPVAGVMVKAWDKDFGNKELMGSAKTDRRGRYMIVYKSKRWDGLNIGPSLGETSNPDIFISVQNKKGSAIESKVYENHPVKKALKINMNID